MFFSALFATSTSFPPPSFSLISSLPPSFSLISSLLSLFLSQFLSNIIFYSLFLLLLHAMPNPHFLNSASGVDAAGVDEDDGWAEPTPSYFVKPVTTGLVGHDPTAVQQGEAEWGTVSACVSVQQGDANWMAVSVFLCGRVRRNGWQCLCTLLCSRVRRNGGQCLPVWRCHASSSAYVTAPHL